MTHTSFTQLTPHLWVTQSPLFATNSGIFISNGQACLIDPGIAPDTVKDIAHFVTEHAAAPHIIAITHGHWDHMLGPRHFPGVNVVAHTHYLTTLHQHGEHIRQQVAHWAEQSNIQGMTPFVLPRPTYAFDKTLQLMMEGLTLRFMHAPGHAPDQMVIYHAESGTLWAGDMLSDAEIPMVMDSLAAYEHTLARLAALDIRVLIPGHGTPTDDPAEVHTRFAQDRAYLAELRARVAHAIETGMTQEEALAYCDDIPLAQPADYTSAHQWNVESAYAELGAATGAPDEGPVGWARDWLQ